MAGKALADICGKPMLGHIVDTTRKSQVDEVVVATTFNSQPIIDYCIENEISYYIGSEEDILDRIYQCAKKYEADVIVRLWGDAPLINEGQIDSAISMFNSYNLEGDHYTTCSDYNGVVAVMNFGLLEKSILEIDSVDNRHWIHKYMSDCKLYTVDRNEDLEKVRIIVRNQRDN